MGAEEYLAQSSKLKQDREEKNLSPALDKSNQSEQNATYAKSSENSKNSIEVDLEGINLKDMKYEATPETGKHQDNNQKKESHVDKFSRRENNVGKGGHSLG